QHGLLIYDLEKFRFRPLLTENSAGLLRFRTPPERSAHDLLAKEMVRIEIETRIPGVDGQDLLELTGSVATTGGMERPHLVLDEEDRAIKANCSCRFFRKNE